MAKAGAKKENAIARYIRETRTELQKTRWPERQEAIRLTQIVLAVTVSMGLFLWLADLLFDWWLGGVVNSDPVRIGLALVMLVAVLVLVMISGRRSD